MQELLFSQLGTSISVLFLACICYIAISTKFDFQFFIFEKVIFCLPIILIFSKKYIYKIKFAEKVKVKFFQIKFYFLNQPSNQNKFCFTGKLQNVQFQLLKPNLFFCAVVFTRPSSHSGTIQRNNAVTHIGADVIKEQSLFTQVQVHMLCTYT